MSADDPVHAHPDGADLEVQVVPRASQSRVVGLHDGRLKVQLAAPPVDGAANAALVELLADTLGLPRGDVRVVRGQTGKRKTLRIARLAPAEVRGRLATWLGALLLLAPACESSYDFPIKVVFPEDLDLARADNAAVELAPQGFVTSFEIKGGEFSLELELEPDEVTRTLSLYIAEGEDLLAWGRSAPFVLSAPPDDLAVYVASPGALSTFPGKISSPDADTLACAAFGRGMLLLRSDGGTGLFNTYTLATETGVKLDPEGGLPDPGDGALVPDSAGGIWRVAWAERLRAFRYEPGTDTWTTIALPDADIGARPGAAHLHGADLETLLVLGGGEQRSAVRIDLAPDDAGAYAVTVLPQQLDGPRRGATAMYLVRDDGDVGEGVVLVGGDDEAASLGLFVPAAEADAEPPAPVSFGPAGAWTGLQCAQLDRGDAAGEADVVRVLCLGGTRGGADTTGTTDAIVLNFPPAAANMAPTLELRPGLLPAAAPDPRLFVDDFAVYAQSDAQWLRVDRDTLWVQSQPSPSNRVRGGHSVLLATGATFLVGGWAPDDRAVDYWHVFVPTLGPP